ncbi:MAG: thioesterase family protein [Myxococcales bacterium]|nr:thioesterase family protein [Myxococcales bacterium]
MSSHFDRLTALESAAEPGCFSGHISEDYWVQSGPNGGYLAAIALRGAMLCIEDAERIPRSLHARFLAAPVAGPFELSTEVLRQGRSMTTLELRMRQEGRVFLAGSACFSRPFSEVAYQDVAMPAALPLEESEALPKQIPMNHRYDMYRAIGGEFRKSERALTGGWIRFADPRPLDALAAAALWDAWPPAPFARAMEQRFRGAAPTVEVSVYFKRPLPLCDDRPGDFALLQVESTMADQGFTEESAALFSRDGRLLMQARQLALLI